MLSPLGNTVLFAFVDDNAKGRFIDKTRSGILLTHHGLDNQMVPRCGRVLAVGPEVGEAVRPGKFILVEAGKWTTKMTYDQVDIWKTEEKYVIGTSDEQLLRH